MQSDESVGAPPPSLRLSLWLLTCQRFLLICTAAARLSFNPRPMVGIMLRNPAARQLRVFPPLLLDKGLSSMLTGPRGKPESSIPLLYHPGLWLSQSDDVIVEWRDVMEAQKICFCEDALQMTNCSAHTEAVKHIDQLSSIRTDHLILAKSHYGHGLLFFFL